jgi:hypothetical protein
VGRSQSEVRFAWRHPAAGVPTPTFPRIASPLGAEPLYAGVAGEPQCELKSGGVPKVEHAPP